MKISELRWAEIFSSEADNAIVYFHPINLTKRDGTRNFFPMLKVDE